MSNSLFFTKFHGAGNDFILIDYRNLTFSLNQEQIAFLCHRRLGIGADGLIFIEKSQSQDTQFYMRYFNADGKESTLCGNGSRCAIAFAETLNMINNAVIFETIAGVHKGEILDKKNQNEWLIALQMPNVTGFKIYEEGIFMDTGSPHFVIPVEDIFDYSVYEEGKKWRHDLRFDGGTNVDFISSIGGKLVVRTFERGVEDETLSCGTGVVASALAWTIMRNLNDGQHLVDVQTPGGDFQLSFEKQKSSFSNIILIGPVKKVFEGTLILE